MGDTNIQEKKKPWEIITFSNVFVTARKKTSSRDTFDNNAQFIMSFLLISFAKLSVCRDYTLTSGMTLSSMVTMVLMVTITF